MKKYPDSVAFLLADSIRQEIDGKHTIVGVYPGDQVVLNGEPQEISKETPNVLPALFLYALFRGGVGSFQATISIKDPHGEQTKPPFTFPIAGQAGVTMTVVANMVPFTVSALGLYTITISLDDTEYSYSFTVTQATAPGLEVDPKGN